MISIVDPAYGGVMNNPAVDNFPALLKAIQAANAAGLEGVSVPSGKLYLTIPTDSIGAQVGAGCRILVKGESKDTTQIIANDASGTSFLFTVAAGGSLLLQDFTAIGPTHNNGFQTRLASHNGTDGALTAYRVATQNYLTPLFMYDGATCDLWTEYCAFTSPGSGPTTLQVGANNIRRARILNCDFRGFGVAGSNQAHAIYLYQGVDAEIRGCSYDQQYGTGYAIQLYGGTGNSPNARIEDCEFGAGVYQAILTNPTVRTRIAGCRSLSLASSVLAQFNTDIVDCDFTVSAPLASPIAQVGSQAAKIRILDSRFDIPATGVYAVTLANAGSRALLMESDFTCNEYYAVSAAPGATYDVRGCEFLDEVGHFLLKAKQLASPTLSSVDSRVANAGVAGNDMRGYIQFDVTASIPAGTALFTFAPNQEYSAAPYVLVTNSNALIVASFGVSAVGYSGFTVRNMTPLTPGAGLHCAYLAVS